MSRLITRRTRALSPIGTRDMRILASVSPTRRSPPPIWLPTEGGELAALFGNLSTEGGANHYWADAAVRANFAAWHAVLSGTFARASDGSRRNAPGLFAIETTDVLRFEHDSAGTLLGILNEPAATQLVLRSNAFTTSPWSQIGIASRTQNADGPDGTTSAWTIAPTAATGAHFIFQPFTAVAGTVYVRSVLMKAGTHPYVLLRQTGPNGHYVSVVFDLLGGGSAGTQTAVGSSSGTLIGHAMAPFANGLFLLAVAYSLGVTNHNVSTDFVPAATGNAITAGGTHDWAVAPAGTETLICAHDQVELGAVASSRIVSGASTVTRAADALGVTIPAGIAELTFRFDNDSEQTVSVSPGTYAVPTNLNRRIIKSIGAFLA